MRFLIFRTNFTFGIEEQKFAYALVFFLSVL